MIVIIDESLFEQDPVDDILLLSILQLGRSRLKIRTRPAFRERAHQAMNRWLNEQSARARGQAVQALKRGLKEDDYELPMGRVEPMVVLEARDAPWWPDRAEAGAVRLPLNEASLRFLTRELHLLLENGRNDFGFLRKAIPDTWRRRFEQAFERNWISPKNGGGIDEMRRIIEEQLACDDPARLRTWALFDSDARAPGDPSTSSERTRKACESWHIPYYRLERRTIENYLPRDTLYDWARRERNKRERNKRLQMVEAFCAMSVEQRHHFHMKEGFAKDTKHGLPEIYANVSEETTRCLQTGFGDGDFTDIWRREDYVIAESALDRDGSKVERIRLFQSLFASL